MTRKEEKKWLDKRVIKVLNAIIEARDLTSGSVQDALMILTNALDPWDKAKRPLLSKHALSVLEAVERTTIFCRRCARRHLDCGIDECLFASIRRAMEKK